MISVSKYQHLMSIQIKEVDRNLIFKFAVYDFSLLLTVAFVVVVDHLTFSDL